MKARETLERIIFNEDVNDHLKKYENASGRQIKFMAKVHRLPEEEQKRRLDEIIVGGKQSSELQVLFGPDGESTIFPPAKIKDISSPQRYTVDPITKVIELKEPEVQKSISKETQIFP